MPDSTNNQAEPTSDRLLATSRVIDAPRERLFKAFSDPKHLAAEVKMVK